MTDQHTPNEQTPQPNRATADAAEPGVDEQNAAEQGTAEQPTAQPQPAAAPSSGGEQADSGASPATVPEESELLDALREVIDPELMINVVDLGLVYAVNQDGATVYVDMTLTSPACPAGPQIVQQAKMALERLDGVDAAEIKLVMSPPWSPERMTEDARDRLGIF